MTERLDIATKILAAMIASPPLVDRTTIDKDRWCDIALQWADKLIDADNYDREQRSGESMRSSAIYPIVMVGLVLLAALIIALGQAAS